VPVRLKTRYRRAGDGKAEPTDSRRDALYDPRVAPDGLAYTGEELAPRAHISIVQARSIALRTIPGEITDEELETEDGGSGLRYTFNIRRGAKTYEVGIDASTGAMLENTIEGQAQH